MISSSHYLTMNCPVCNVTLVMSERSGVEIDYCPQCRGVWLDRGELDKIIEKSGSGQNTQQTPQQSAPAHTQYYDNKQYHKPHKKESFLSDLFDF